MHMSKLTQTFVSMELNEIAHKLTNRQRINVIVSDNLDHLLNDTSCISFKDSIWIWTQLRS